MKRVLIAVVLATLTGSLASAEPTRNERPPASGIHLKRPKERANYRNLYLGREKTVQPTLNADPEQELCLTAPGFCPGYFGGNG